jgi:hypothetical protein
MPHQLKIQPMFFLTPSGKSFRSSTGGAA